MTVEALRPVMDAQAQAVVRLTRALVSTQERVERLTAQNHLWAEQLVSAESRLETAEQMVDLFVQALERRNAPPVIRDPTVQGPPPQMDAEWRARLSWHLTPEGRAAHERALEMERNLLAEYSEEDMVRDLLGEG